MTSAHRQARMDAAADQDARDMLSRCHTCAEGYRLIDQHFSASFVEGFARDIEAGTPWQFYRHFVSEAEARLERLSA